MEPPVASNIEHQDAVPAIQHQPEAPSFAAPTLDGGAHDDHRIRNACVIALDGRPCLFAGGDQLAGLGCLGQVCRGPMRFHGVAKRVEVSEFDNRGSASARPMGERTAATGIGYLIQDSRGRQRIERGERHDVGCFGSHGRIDGDEGIGLELADGKVFGLERCVPTVVSCDVPCGAAGHSVAEEPDLRFRDAFMVFECGLFRHLTIADGSKEQRQDLGLDQLGGHELMRHVDFDVAGNEVQQGRGIDHVAGHPCTVQGHIDVIGTRRGARSSRGA